jgi:pyruvate/2-oxoglutarate/acetoin dehydrogenase E1 component
MEAASMHRNIIPIARKPFLAHTPGIKVVIPSTPYEAKGLLLSSIRDPDPVIFMEPKRIYRAIREEVPEGDYTIPLGKARLVQEGKDVTIVAWGAMVREVLRAAEMVEKEGVKAEVIDLRTISPLDDGLFLESVRKREGQSSFMRPLEPADWGRRSSPGSTKKPPFSPSACGKNHGVWIRLFP